MEKLRECKLELYEAYFQPKTQSREVRQKKHAKLGTILKVKGSIGGLGEKCFYLPTFSQESTMWAEEQG